MQEFVDVELNAKSPESLEKYQRDLKTFFDGEEWTDWINSMKVPTWDPMRIVIESDTAPVSFFDFEGIKKSVFLYIAKQNPDWDFNASIHYDDCDMVSSTVSVVYENGVYYEVAKNGNRKVVFCKPEFEGAYEMPDSVNQIQPGAFEGCGKLVSVSVSPKVKKIGAKVFSNCSSLEKVLVPKGVAVSDKAIVKSPKAVVEIVE